MSDGESQPEPKTPKDTVREALAKFLAITASASVIGRAYWLTVRGDCELGLCMTSMLTVEEYSSVLLVSELVTLSNNVNERVFDTKIRAKLHSVPTHN